MFRKFLSLAFFLIGILSLNAQWPALNQLNQLPLNPKVKSGVLPNGLSYYIMHNEEPKQRANFYIAQKVGSTLEAQDQLGLAHFLEHMAFNGTTNFPGKTMLNYLQSKGIRFGADINAYTAFDETVYNINNVPTNDKNLMDSVLLVLHDWSGDILLEEAEIDAERGVIQEEWRMSNNADTRMYTTILPQIYEEYQYQQMPIGKIDIIRNFKPEVLRAYYKKWYRPDLQGIVIVGDFDADEMERKVKDLFSNIEMPKNAAKRTYPKVSDNKKPIYVTYTDPELTNMMTRISFKSEKVPFELRNTVEMYAQTTMLELLISKMMNNRLDDFALTPECDYAYAAVGFGDFYVSKTKDSFNIIVLAKTNSQDAVADVMSVVARACKTGFTASEMQRAADDILANLERQLNEKDKTDNEAYGKELCRFFIDNEPAPGIETEYMIWQQMLPMLPVEAINEMIQDLLTDDNMVVVTSAPKADGFEIVAEDAMLSTIKTAMKAEYEALVDEVITEPLIANLPTPGKITNVEENAALGTTTFTLSNGIKVVLKPTDFSADEILMTAYREGGKRLYSPDQAANVLMMPDAFESSKMGPFDQKTLIKFLAGKKVDLSFSVNNYTDVLKGSSTIKDLPVLFELIYTAFTNLNPDAETYNINIERAIPMFENMEKNPQIIFRNERYKTEFGGNPLMMPATLATLKDANYMEAMELVHGVLKNAAEFTFIFTGNVDKATIRPLLEQYIATLPVARRKKLVEVSPVTPVKGNVVNEFKQPMQTPSTIVFNNYSDNNIPFNMENDIMVDLMGDVLSNIFIDTLREEEGGTYSPSVFSQFNPNSNEWSLLYLFQTNADQQANLIKRANDEYLKLLNEGADDVNFNKVKEAMIKQYEINSNKNQFWDNALMLQLRYPNIQLIEGYEETLKNITLDKFNNFLKNLYNGKNRIQVIMEGVEAEN